ncbi:MAG: prepilin-type N-terminal cleavage/methylation domain-containing protein [Thermoleophilia bacterium]|nr:prepilin-type N-terminal cleavage/methylation domain-containing protein [Thermoleophilia bacterium]
MQRRTNISSSGGFSLIELMVVVVVLGICLAGGVAALSDGLSAVETRGAAQDWQAAAAWAQVGVLWQGGCTQAACDSGSVALTHEYGLCGGDLGRSTAATDVEANVARWRVGGGIAVTFGGSLASPDGGGSLHFQNNGGAYRVVVRPESGLTVRSPAGVRP